MILLTNEENPYKDALPGQPDGMVYYPKFCFEEGAKAQLKKVVLAVETLFEIDSEAMYLKDSARNTYWKWQALLEEVTK